MVGYTFQSLKINVWSDW